MPKERAPSWTDIRRLRRKVVRLAGEDRFLKTVLSGCSRVGRDSGNRLRGNFVASGLREAVGHILHKLSPDEEVRRCVWFSQAKDTPTITRRQRAEYIVRGGLPDSFIQQELGLELADLSDPLLAALDELNKRTHVRPNTLMADGSAVRKLFHSTLSELGYFLEAAKEARRDVTNAVADVMHRAVFDSLISDTIQELDELSTHTTIEDHYIDTVDVIYLSATEVTYELHGTVEVELQYGSNSDVENDIGLRQADSYPYTASVTCKAAEPMVVASEDVELSVDNSSFYE